MWLSSVVVCDSQRSQRFGAVGGGLIRIMLKEHLGAQRGHSFLYIRFQFFDFAAERRIHLGNAFVPCGNVNVQGTVLKGQPVVFIQSTLKDRFEAVVITMGNGIVLVRMTSRAFDGQAHDARSQYADGITNHAQSLRHKIHGT